MRVPVTAGLLGPRTAEPAAPAQTLEKDPTGSHRDDLASPRVAIVHDYLTQRGGAERVVLAMVKAFPKAPLYVSLYDPAATFPEFRTFDVRPSSLDRLTALRRNHRLALPL